ncbi:hypothetical protein [Burkholderia vietnamiensis]|uniref:hypothetical protein n=1 Tax=Burkholderia vietnamiensis TaxID=60552 RepID=UPI0015945C43|nr:hypothetical protein [Burkholderia vietnamiensis]MCA8197310.1 hypothetical protein [Burkholderia vietnamiensis]UEC05626.1 hypothetical protein LK462_34890 [Burkholderia vietnamiensis]
MLTPQHNISTSSQDADSRPDRDRTTRTSASRRKNHPDVNAMLAALVHDQRAPT